MGIQKFRRPLLVVDTEVPPEGGFGGGAVDSVNGQTGDVVLAASDVGALPDSYAPAWGDVTGKPTFAAVATSGAYADLTGTPSIPESPGDIGAATAAQGALASSAVQPGDLAAVATSGAYSDLSGTPALDFATISAIEGDWRGEGVETLGAALLALQGA